MTKKLSTPFAVNSKLRNDIPVSTTTAGQASYDVGFPNETFQSLANGGIPPDGKDFNGVLHDISANIVDMNMGLPQYFDSAYSTLLGGYPIGARLCLNDNSGFVVSTIANNQNDPNSNITGWKTLDYQEYDFKTEQPIQYYYDKLGNWDDAIYLAQKNIVAKGYSCKLRFPSKLIDITRPILGGPALGDKLNTDYPELQMKDSNGAFQKSFPTQIYGSAQPPYTYKGQIDNGTIIRFVGCKSQTDLTYMNFGIIHNAPTNPLDFANGTSTTEDTWGYNNVIVDNVSITCLNQDGSVFAPIHGIFMFRHHFHRISNIAVDGLYGSAILGNWVFDSNIENYVITRCGRMSPNINDYQNDGNFSIEYQTYAPLHLLCTNPNDSTNFIKCHRGHFEHNYRAVADIILSGSTPIWIDKNHHESGQGLIANAKCALATNYGVSYPCQDSESGFDYKSFTKPSRACVVICNDITGYTPQFKNAIIMGAYTSIICSAWRFSADILINSNNTDCKLQAVNSSFNNISATGGTFAQKWLEISQTTLHGDMKLEYAGAISLIDVNIEGNFSANSMKNTYKSTLLGVTANTFTGDIKSASCDIVQLSASSNVLQASNGVVNYSDLSKLSGAW